MMRLKLKYSLLVPALCALACSQQLSTSPSELARDTAPSSSAISALTSFGLNVEDPEDQGLCARSPGFWCQNQDGQNPNLTPEQWEDYLPDAVDLLNEILVDKTNELEVAEGVCDVRRQLFRHLAALALNLAAGFVDPEELLTGEDPSLVTVADAFIKGAETYRDGDAVPFEDRQAIKDTMDRINNNVNLTNDCTPDEEENGEGEGGTGETGQTGETGETGETVGGCTVEPDGKIAICHVPPGNPAAAHVIRIDPAAWQAHEGHGDYCAPCK
jgi:hypothetical protein